MPTTRVTVSMAQNKFAQACRDLDDWLSLHLPSTFDAK